MEQKEIIEGNKLIAEFMGGQYRKTENWILPGTTLEQYLFDYFPYEPTERCVAVVEYGVKRLRYHLDWHWLMPVVEKINQSNKWDIIIYRSTVHVNDRMDMIIETTSEEYGSLLLAVFGAVLQFIQFYNALNNPSKDKADGK